MADPISRSYRMVSIRVRRYRVMALVSTRTIVPAVKEYRTVLGTDRVHVVPRKPRQPPFPNQNSEERTREILEEWSATESVRISPCEICGHPMLGKRHAELPVKRRDAPPGSWLGGICSYARPYQADRRPGQLSEVAGRSLVMLLTLPRITERRVEKQAIRGTFSPVL
jgi:hypothetical protein